MSARPPTLDELLEAVRSYVAGNLPGERAVSLRVTLASGMRVESPVPVVPQRKELPPRRHSLDFRSCSWDGADYHFSPTQAAVVRVLWEAWEDGTPDVGSETLLEASGSEGGRVRDLFKNHPSWGNLIVSVGKGLFRLAG